MDLNIQLHAPSKLPIYNIGPRTYLTGAKRGNFLPLVRMEHILLKKKKKKKRNLLLRMYFKNFFLCKNSFEPFSKRCFFFAKSFDG
jgi:hypothetical protein